MFPEGWLSSPDPKGNVYNSTHYYNQVFLLKSLMAERKRPLEFNRWHKSIIFREKSLSKGTKPLCLTFLFLSKGLGTGDMKKIPKTFCNSLTVWSKTLKPILSLNIQDQKLHQTQWAAKLQVPAVFSHFTLQISLQRAYSKDLMSGLVGGAQHALIACCQSPL